MIKWLAAQIAAMTLMEVAWFLAAFVATFTLSLAEVTFLLVKIRPDYFRKHRPRTFWAERHTVLRALGLVGKNVLGVLHVIVGILLSLPGVPGQGVLTILIGVMMLDLPGVRWLERRLVRRPRVRQAIDRIRARFGKPPLILDEDVVPATQPVGLAASQRVPA